MRGQVVEVHGTIHDVVCLDCGARSPSGPTLERVPAGEADPACLACGGMLKSATISSASLWWEADLDRAFEAAAACDLLLAIGSTLSVYPVAAMVPTARQFGASVVIVNAEPTDGRPRRRGRPGIDQPGPADHPRGMKASTPGRSRWSDDTRMPKALGGGLRRGPSKSEFPEYEHC